MLTFYSEHTLFERFDTLTNNYFKISKGAFIFVKEGTISFERNGSFLKCEHHSIVILSSGDICRLIEVPPNVKLIDKKQTINSNKGKMDRKYFKKKGKIIEKNNMSL